MRTRALQAGMVYFCGALALGFAFGGLRRMALVPLLGELWAVLVEVPVMLVLCWILCRRAVAMLHVAPRLAERALMGATAFALLMVAELLLARLLTGDSLSRYLAAALTPERLVGLLGQLLFAAFPVLQIGGEFRSGPSRHGKSQPASSAKDN